MQSGEFGKKLTVLQFFTFVNESIAIMLDSGIDIAYYSGPSPGGSKFVSGGAFHPIRGGWINP